MVFFWQNEAGNIPVLPLVSVPFHQSASLSSVRSIVSPCLKDSSSGFEESQAKERSVSTRFRLELSLVHTLNNIY